MRTMVEALIERAKLAAILKGLPKKQAAFRVRGEWPELSGPCTKIEVDGKEVEDPKLRARIAAILPFSRPGEDPNSWRARNAKKKKK